MWLALHGDVEEWMKKLFCVPNAMQDFIADDQEVPLKAYPRKPGRQEAFMQQFAQDGFAPAL